MSFKIGSGTKTPKANNLNLFPRRLTILLMRWSGGQTYVWCWSNLWNRPDCLIGWLPFEIALLCVISNYKNRHTISNHVIYVAVCSKRVYHRAGIQHRLRCIIRTHTMKVGVNDIASYFLEMLSDIRFILQVEQSVGSVCTKRLRPGLTLDQYVLVCPSTENFIWFCFFCFYHMKE